MHCPPPWCFCRKGRGLALAMQITDHLSFNWALPIYNWWSPVVSVDKCHERIMMWTQKTTSWMIVCWWHSTIVQRALPTMSGFGLVEQRKIVVIPGVWLSWSSELEIWRMPQMTSCFLCRSQHARKVFAILTETVNTSDLLLISPHGAQHTVDVGDVFCHHWARSSHACHQQDLLLINKSKPLVLLIGIIKFLLLFTLSFGEFWLFGFCHSSCGTRGRRMCQCNWSRLKQSTQEGKLHWYFVWLSEPHDANT
jgi:hypothetical protein